VDMSHAIVWSREALRMSLLLGGPLLAAAFLVGLLVNIGQTLTQLHRGSNCCPSLDLAVVAHPLGLVRCGIDRVDPQFALV
jgi:type III secretory pathway component EscS